MDVIFCRCGDAAISPPEVRCYKCVKRAAEDPGYEPKVPDPNVSAGGLTEEQNQTFWGVFGCYTALVGAVGFLVGFVLRGVLS